jgi:hypothetical protein
VSNKQNCFNRHFSKKNIGVKKITLPVLDFDEFSRSVRTPEITNDPSYFSNATMGMYYNIDSIFAGKVVKKSELSLKRK